MSCDASTPYYTDFVTVAESLRCPVCQGQRIASSDSPFALKVKEDICASLHEGLSASQVITRMEKAYGADLHVENSASGTMLPLVGIIVVIAAFALWKLKTFVLKSSAPR